MRGVASTHKEGNVSEEGTTVKQAASQMARFWSKHRAQALDAPMGSKRKDIRLDDWAYEGHPNTREATFLRSPEVRDRFQVFEVLQGPYENPVIIAQFIRFLEDLMYTGYGRADGPSPEGRNSVLAMLTEDQARKLPKEIRNKPARLAAAVAGLVRLNVEEFDTGE